MNQTGSSGENDDLLASLCAEAEEEATPELLGALSSLRELGTLQAPEPSAQLRAVMSGKVVPIKRRHRGTIIGVVVAASMGLGVGAVAANEDFRGSLQAVVDHAVETVLPEQTAEAGAKPGKATAVLPPVDPGKYDGDALHPGYGTNDGARLDNGDGTRGPDDGIGVDAPGQSSGGHHREGHGPAEMPDKAGEALPVPEHGQPGQMLRGTADVEADAPSEAVATDQDAVASKGKEAGGPGKPDDQKPLQLNVERTADDVGNKLGQAGKELIGKEKRDEAKPVPTVDRLLADANSTGRELLRGPRELVKPVQPVQRLVREATHPLHAPRIQDSDNRQPESKGYGSGSEPTGQWPEPEVEEEVPGK